MLKLITTSLTNIARILPRVYLNRGVFVILLLLLNSLLDVVGLASLIPLFSIILKKDIIHENEIINSLYSATGFSDERHFILLLCGIIVLLIVSKNIVSVWISYVQAKYSYSLFQFFCTNLQRYYFEQGMLYFKSRNSNLIVRDINVIPSWFVNFVVLPLLLLINELTILVIIVIGICFYEFKVLLLLAVIIIPASSLFYRATRNQVRKISERKKELNPAINTTLFQSIFGFVDIEMSNSREWFFKDYKLKVQELTGLLAREFTYKKAPAKVMDTSMVVGVLGIIIYGLYTLDDTSSLVMLLGVFGLAGYRIMPSVNRILTAVISIKSYQFTFDTIQLVDKVISKIPVNNLENLSFKDKVEVRNVFFEYEEETPVLKDISFTINKGESIGIVGKSGSGKTTLLNMMLGFLQPGKGFIRVDGVVLSEQNIMDWRQIVGYVQQDVYLLDATLAENVTFGVPPAEVDQEKLMKVIRLASLQELVDQLPKGVYSNVGERGAQISGGQRQRIGIARALYSGAEILFFDEATSSLDHETESEITAAIQNLSEEGFTAVIISHRISTLKYCDNIIELEDGRIKQITSYKNLLQKVVLK